MFNRWLDGSIDENAKECIVTNNKKLTVVAKYNNHILFR